MKEMAIQKAKEESKKAESMDLDDLDAENTPLMRSMLNLHNELERMKVSITVSKEPAEKIDIQPKLEICDTLDFLLDIRSNYLINNFIIWFYKIGRKSKKRFEELRKNKSQEKINKSLSKLLPTIPKTGIHEIDEEYALVSYRARNMLLPFSEENKTLKHVNYAEKVKREGVDNEHVEDLDTLFLHGLQRKLHFDFPGVLPRLLVTFLNTKDSVLENRRLHIIMRIFNQRTELFNSLQKFEIIFGEAEKEAFLKIESYSKQLRSLTE